MLYQLSYARSEINGISPEKPVKGLVDALYEDVPASLLN